MSLSNPLSSSTCRQMFIPHCLHLPMDKCLFPIVFIYPWTDVYSPLSSSTHGQMFIPNFIPSPKPQGMKTEAGSDFKGDAITFINNNSVTVVSCISRNTGKGMQG